MITYGCSTGLRGIVLFREAMFVWFFDVLCCVVSFLVVKGFKPLTEVNE